MSTQLSLTEFEIEALPATGGPWACADLKTSSYASG
jgi:hypothetical protein